MYFHSDQWTCDTLTRLLEWTGNRRRQTPRKPAIGTVAAHYWVTVGLKTELGRVAFEVIAVSDRQVLDWSMLSITTV